MELTSYDVKLLSLVPIDGRYPEKSFWAATFFDEFYGGTYVFHLTYEEARKLPTGNKPYQMTISLKDA